MARTRVCPINALLGVNTAHSWDARRAGATAARAAAC